MSTKTIQPGLQVQEPLAPAKNLPVLLILYLLGIFMGAIDTGIVSPARTIIQGALGVDERTGIWMITIYTLAYAAIIPISGKLADRYGRKIVYLASIGLFGLGSAICALSASTGLFWVMLIGRVVQALGGGGIMPIATAEFGTSFPEKKRGMALGLVGGVYGIANILGASAGSAIMDIFGTSRWDLIFLVNVPIALAIIVFGLFLLPNNFGKKTQRIDWAGIPILTVMILSLMYGLKNIDFFDFGTSLLRLDAFPFLLAFLALLPALLFVERRAKDPILAFGYFTNRATLITLILSFFVGVLMMGMVFVPQLAENVLRISSGSGGYFVAVLGVFAGLSAPFSGAMIDRFGPKRILLTGFAISLFGALMLIFITIPFPSTIAVLASLAIMGFGLGFTMGTPLNYMMLQDCPKDEAGSALATLSLVRSIGTAIAPAIMIGFIAHAGASAQPKLMALLPPVDAPRLELSDTLESQLTAVKANPALAGMMAGMEIPSFGAPAGMDFSMGSQGGAEAGALPPEMATKLRSADVTTITDRIKELAEFMYDEKTPEVIKKIQEGIGSGKLKLREALNGMDAAARPSGMPAVIPSGMPVGAGGGLAGMQGARVQLAAIVQTMDALEEDVPAAFARAKLAYIAKIETLRPEIDSTFQKTLNSGFTQMYIVVAAMSLLAGLVLLFYRGNVPKPKEAE